MEVLRSGSWLLYAAKSSTKMQRLEANGNQTRMLEFITLGEEERKLIEQGIILNQSLLKRLEGEPTPAGPTPHELQLGRGKSLPILTKTVGLLEQKRIAVETAPRYMRVWVSREVDDPEKILFAC